MVFLLAGLAIAQEPQVFDPVPADVTIEGQFLSGILVDEHTFADMTNTMILQHNCQRNLTMAREAHANLVVLTDEERERWKRTMEEAGRRTFLEQHGLAIGFFAGVALTGASVVLLSQ